MKSAVAVVTRDHFVTWEMKALHRAARKRGVVLVRLDPLRWAFDIEDLSFHDAVHKRRGLDIRAALGRIDQDAVPEGARVLELLARSGVPTINGPASARIGRDKALAALALRSNGVPQPASRVMTALPSGRLRRIPYPVVVKPLVGGKGAGVAKASGPKELARLLHEGGSPKLVQEFVGNAERELRLVVLDGEVLACVAKRPRLGDWRANLSLGGKAEPAEPAAATAAAALRAAAAVEADFAAVDVFETPRGPLVIDVNVCPGFQHVEAATGAEIAGRVIDSLCRRMFHPGRSGNHRQDGDSSI